ncbi:MAG: potassium-transporting ATPase subunit F [Pseudomonadota bacterium]
MNPFHIAGAAVAAALLLYLVLALLRAEEL